MDPLSINGKGVEKIPVVVGLSEKLDDRSSRATRSLESIADSLEKIRTSLALGFLCLVVTSPTVASAVQIIAHGIAGLFRP